ncbi:hypothetical protein [Brevirhabdus sp.]|uniref:hypothetical protein n=1 Tax=Brevirhabdus sp. TaxID=2004514 RepID=UPI0040586E58
MFSTYVIFGVVLGAAAAICLLFLDCQLWTALLAYAVIGNLATLAFTGMRFSTRDTEEAARRSPDPLRGNGKSARLATDR